VLLAITAYPCLDLSISSVPATDKDADGLPALQQTSMPRERLRSILKIEFARKSPSNGQKPANSIT
jgi:hypothetical protein